MKIFISISLSFLILLQGIVGNMDLCQQIEKFSHFISNYQDHKELDGYSFIEYVYKDYIINDECSDDNHPESEHENYPLHIHHHCCQHSVFDNPFVPAINKVGRNNAQNQIGYNNLQLPATYLETLFQPPRM